MGLLKTSLICCLLFIPLGCASESGHPKAGTHEDARQVILDYVKQYEQNYIEYSGTEMEKRLARVESEYHKRMAKLAEEGKWTPWSNVGKTIKLSFLVGEFHGALQSCKIEKASGDKRKVGCNQVENLKTKILWLLSE